MRRSTTKSYSLLAVYLLMAVTICAGCAGFPQGDLAMIGRNDHGAPHRHGSCAGDCGDECGESCGCESSACGDMCEGESSTGEVLPFYSVLSSATAISAVPLAFVGNVANFCLPVTALAPPQVPPPGRFHPVPTKPVFRGVGPVY
jgi:hypothetical protein